MLIEEALRDPVSLVIAVLLLISVFTIYLFLRRTVVGFREGLDDGRR